MSRETIPMDFTAGRLNAATHGSRDFNTGYTLAMIEEEEDRNARKTP